MRCCVPEPEPELDPDAAAVVELEEVDGSGSLLDLTGVCDELGVVEPNEGPEVASDAGFAAALYDRFIVDVGRWDE